MKANEANNVITTLVVNLASTKCDKIDIKKTSEYLEVGKQTSEVRRQVMQAINDKYGANAPSSDEAKFYLELTKIADNATSFIFTGNRTAYISKCKVILQAWTEALKVVLSA